MSRMKTFLKYLVVFIILYIVFDFFAYRYLVNSYKNIKTYEILSEQPDVIVKEAKATAVNGYVIAQIKNNTGVDIAKTNVKIDLYNSRGNILGTKYVKLENFNQNETREIKANFKASNIEHIKISFTDENVDAEIQKQAEELSNTVNKWFPIVGLVTLICSV